MRTIGNKERSHVSLTLVIKKTPRKGKETRILSNDEIPLYKLNYEVSNELPLLQRKLNY